MLSFPTKNMCAYYENIYFSGLHIIFFVSSFMSCPTMPDTYLKVSFFRTHSGQMQAGGEARDGRIMYHSFPTLFIPLSLMELILQPFFVKN